MFERFFSKYRCSKFFVEIQVILWCENLKLKIKIIDSLDFQYCPQVNYNFEQEITDIGCRLTGLKCGDNMIFITVEHFFAGENSNDIVGCIQTCKCKDDFMYSKKDRKCIKEVWIIFILGKFMKCKKDIILQ